MHLGPSFLTAIAVGTLYVSNVVMVDAADPGPSFDCSRVTSEVNHLICGSTELSALDRKLADDFESTVHQAGVDGKALRAEENHWLRAIRNPCASTECLKAAYQARDVAILDLSLRAASPAAYQDTRPFSVPPAAESTARQLVGTSWKGGPADPLPGTSRIDGYHVIVARDGYVVPLEIQGGKFAFLIARSDSDPERFTIRDFAALPTSSEHMSFLQCSLGDDSRGFAIRRGRGTTVAYWSISDDIANLRREPIHVLGEQSLRCQEPETGE